MSLPESKIILYGAGKKRPETQPHLPRGAGNGADLLFRPVGRPGRRRSAENGRGQHDPQGSPGSPLRAEIHADVKIYFSDIKRVKIKEEIYYGGFIP